MDYYLDTEFIEDGKTIELISIGIVAEDGRELYLQNQECDFASVSGWIEDNVLPHLVDFDLNTYTCIGHEGSSWRSPTEIAREVIEFIGDDKPRFIGYYADYDWVVFCWLFGAMIDLPKGWPMYCYDIKQLCDDLGNPQLPQQGKGEHHALADARWNKLAHEFLLGLKK
jgi:hypothetical protein